MRSRSKESREGSRSKGKPPKNLLSGDNFRISKINLHSGSDVRLNHVRFRKSLLLEPSTLAQERAFMESQSPLKTSLSTTAARVKAALAITEDSSLLPKKNATVIVDRASTITPLNAFINALQENESKEVRLEPAKTSKKEVGPVRAYAANTRASSITDANSQRISIVTNLQPIGRNSPNQQVSFFAIYDGHGGGSCAEYLRDNLHVYLSKDQRFPQEVAEALTTALRKVQTDYLKIAEKKGDSCGSSALVVVLVSSLTGKTFTKCHVAWVGNSRAVISRSNGAQVCQLSTDHSPHTDRQYRRITKAGGTVYQHKSSQIADESNAKNSFRVVPGRLKCTRAIGSYELKSERYGCRSGIVTGDPEVESYDCEDGDFILMASDGVFEALTNNEAVKAVWATALANRRDSIHEQAGESATAVLYQSLRKSSTDHMSTILICLRGFEQTLFGEDFVELPGRDTP